MKRFLLITALLAIVFIVGCVGDALVLERFDPVTKNRTEKLTVQRLAGMVNYKIGAVKVVVIDKSKKDPNAIFIVLFSASDVNQLESPASATAILNGLTNLETGGVSGAAGNITGK